MPGRSARVGGRPQDRHRAVLCLTGCRWAEQDSNSSAPHQERSHHQTNTRQWARSKISLGIKVSKSGSAGAGLSLGTPTAGLRDLMLRPELNWSPWEQGQGCVYRGVSLFEGGQGRLVGTIKAHASIQGPESKNFSRCFFSSLEMKKKKK